MWVLPRMRCGLLIGSLLCGLSVPTAALTYGNDADQGNGSVHGANFLLGEKIVVSDTFTLTDVGIIFKSAGYNAQVGIYADDGGLPGDLLIDSGAFAVIATGHLLTPVTPMVLSAGSYWFMAVYDQPASVGVVFLSGGFAAYRDLQFGNPLYDPFGPAYTYNSQRWNYYLVGVPVPEPGTAALLVMGLLATSVRRVRRSRGRSGYRPR